MRLIINKNYNNLLRQILLIFTIMVLKLFYLNRPVNGDEECVNLRRNKLVTVGGTKKVKEHF